MQDNKTKIIPASLALTEEELKVQLERISPLSNEIHIDYADGQFVKNTTVDWQILFDLPEFYHDQEFELHLMAKEPLVLAQEAVLRGFVKVIVPVEEIQADEVTILENLSNNCPIYLAVNPETLVADCKPFLPYIGGVMLMGVKPGYQGQNFNNKILTKIADLKSFGFGGKIEIDGGINLKTIDNVLKYPVNELVVGSALIDSVSPKETFEQLQTKARGRLGKSV